MSTRSLLVWVALVAGLEFAVRGHLGDRSGVCHGGALLFALGLAGLCWPGRARRAGRAGLFAAGLLAATVAVDAGASARPAAPAAKSEAGARDSAEDVARVVEEHFECPAGVVLLDVSDPSSPWQSRPADAPTLALLHGGASSLDELIETTPELQAVRGEPTPPRGSMLIAALEGRWQRRQAEARWRLARDAPIEIDPARSRLAGRYRKSLLEARRAGAEVALLVAAPAKAPPMHTGDSRARWLAVRAQARLLRSVAGAYGLRALEVGPDLDELRARLSEPDAGCRERAPQSPLSGSASGRASGRIT